MKIINLTRGKSTIVDDSDYLELSKTKWSLSHYGYGQRGSWKDGKRIKIYIHRQITRCPVGLEVDHINGDRLDNRRSNLRIVNKSQNQMNSKSQIGHSSGFKGVGFHKQAGKWRSFICPKSKYVHLGLFENEKDAALAYNAMAKEVFGEYAKLNII